MVKQSREISHWDIVQSYPAPIAVSYQQYCSVSDQDVVRKARALFAVAEVSARYLTFVLTADFLSTDPGTPDSGPLARLVGYFSARKKSSESLQPALLPDWLAALRPGLGLEFGRWVRAAREVADLLGQRPVFMAELPAVIRSSDAYGLLSNINTLRNKFAHPGGAFELTDDEISGLLRQGKPYLARWLTCLRFLTRYPLCMARREDPFGTSRKSSTFVYSVMRTMGLPVNHHELSVDLSIHLREHLPFLVHPEGDRLLYLWPFVVASEPGPQDTFGNLFVFEKQTRSNLDSIEYVGVAQRRQFELTEHSDHRDPLWVRERRASFPGRLALSTPSLEPLHREAADELVGKSFGDGRSYNIVRRLGRGGMGTVYVATDKSGRPYAIKVLQHRDSRTQQRFKREINALGKLKSTSGIVGLIDWGESKDAQNNPTPYYVMEYADRGDLSTFIRTMCVPLDESKDPIRWDLEPRLKILEDIARALAHLHELGLVHRDIKPENVLLMGDDTVRLADFGLAKALENDEHLTQKWSIVGTPDYMAPELLAGEDANKRSDVFAYGALLFEVLLGRLPTRKGIRKTGDGGTLFDQSAVQAIPDALRRTLLKCTRFEPAERYEDGKALLAGLTDGYPKIRRGKLRIRTDPSGAVVDLNGKAIDQEVIDVESGVHILSASKGNLVCPPKVVRVPPLATVEVVLVLEDPAQTRGTSGERLEDLVASAAALESVLPFLKATKMRIVTRSLGYGTAKGVEDNNSQTAWLSMKSQLGNSSIAPLIQLLESRDSDTRMKALQFLLYYAVESPDSVDVKKIQARMRDEEVPVILGAWINHLERSLQRNWPLLLDLLTAEQLGSNAVGIPNILRRLGSQLDVIDRLVTTLPSIPDTNTRVETVRALSGRHPRATEALLDRMANDPEQSVRGAAVYALADGAPAGVFDQLLRLLETDPAASVRTGCARAILILDRKRASLEFERLRAKGDPAVDAAIESAQV